MKKTVRKRSSNASSHLENLARYACCVHNENNRKSENPNQIYVFFFPIKCQMLYMEKEPVYADRQPPQLHPLKCM